MSVSPGGSPTDQTAQGAASERAGSVTVRYWASARAAATVDQELDAVPPRAVRTEEQPTQTVQAVGFGLCDALRKAECPGTAKALPPCATRR